MAKLTEADALIARGRRMKILLGQALRCGCLRLEDCAEALDLDQSCYADSRSPR